MRDMEFRKVLSELRDRIHSGEVTEGMNELIQLSSTESDRGAFVRDISRPRGGGVGVGRSRGGAIVYDGGTSSFGWRVSGAL